MLVAMKDGDRTYLELVVETLVPLGERAAVLYGVHQVIRCVGELATAAGRLRAGVGARVALRTLRAGFRHVVVLRSGGGRE